jgi:hypothetical protein
MPKRKREVANQEETSVMSGSFRRSAVEGPVFELSTRLERLFESSKSSLEAE